MRKGATLCGFGGVELAESYQSRRLRDDGCGTGLLARTRALFTTSVCVTGAALRQPEVQISWHAHHFRKVKYRFRDRRGIFLLLARTHRKSFRKVKYIFRGRCSTFPRSSKDLVASAALSQGQVQNSWQVQHSRKVKYRVCGKRSTFARSSTDFVAGAALLQGQLSQSGLENRNF